MRTVRAFSALLIATSVCSAQWVQTNGPYGVTFMLSQQAARIFLPARMAAASIYRPTMARVGLPSILA
jgi:hypothetical protein